MGKKKTKPLTTAEVRTALVATLKELQAFSDRPWTDLSWSAKPIGCLDGFDSLASIEATVLLEEKLGRTLKPETVFLSPDGKTALNVEEVCERIVEVLGDS